MAKPKVRLVRNTTDKDTMRPHYDFSKGVRGRYVARLSDGTNVVLLAPDVASVFPDSAAVNKALRSLIRRKRPRKSTSRH